MRRARVLATVLLLGCGGGSGGGDGGPAIDAGALADAAGGGGDAGPPVGGWDPADFDNVYEVGPGQDYLDPSEVPWESLGPSTLVRIHWRSQPYAAKWVINTAATAAAPLVVTGVPDSGRLPVISGDGAVTRLALDYWNEDRSIIKIGGSNLPTDTVVPAYVWVEALDIEGARPPLGFTDDAGNPGSYSMNAAAIHIEIGDHITVRGCRLADAGNGLFASSGASNVVISGNYVVGNGNVGSIYEHNSYTEAFGITFEYNHYGPLCAGCDGNNLKDRSAGTVIRYNWIESGNRQLDLVESDDAGFIADPSYRTTLVYGNVLVEPDGAGNSQIVHYGGDGGDQTKYRKGTLYFYANTVVSTRGGNTTLLRLSSAGESADVRDNLVAADAGAGYLAISAGSGAVALRDNWLQGGWVDSHDTLTGTVDDQGNLGGAAPGFSDAGGGDYTLASGSPCIGAAGPLASGVPPVDRQYLPDQRGEARPDDGDPDIGAFER